MSLEMFFQLLDKNPNNRLGMPGCDAGPIREHSYFKPINWTLLEQRKIEPPFKPKIVSLVRALIR